MLLNNSRAHCHGGGGGGGGSSPSFGTHFEFNEHYVTHTACSVTVMFRSPAPLRHTILKAGSQYIVSVASRTIYCKRRVTYNIFFITTYASSPGCSLGGRGAALQPASIWDTIRTNYHSLTQSRLNHSQDMPHPASKGGGGGRNSLPSLQGSASPPA